MTAEPKDYDEALDDDGGRRMLGGAFERHGQTVLQLLIAALLGWFGLQVVDQGRSMARMEVTVDALNKQILAIQSSFLQGTNDRYRATDAAKDFKIIELRLSHIDSRAASFNDRIGKVEDLLRRQERESGRQQ